MWIVEVEDKDKQDKRVEKKIFHDEQEANVYFQKKVNDSNLTVRLYVPLITWPPEGYEEMT